jgi:drug/metabolite transporter (DMT)-like permease
MKKLIWLYLSSFGIMFAILSGVQEGELLPDHMGWGKGFFACVLGAVLYAAIPRTMQ